MTHHLRQHRRAPCAPEGRPPEGQSATGAPDIIVRQPSVSGHAARLLCLA
ncbi:hypothetical protein [Kibdelosporangium philippinense]